jgi:hypothetical protein
MQKPSKNELKVAKNKLKPIKNCVRVTRDKQQKMTQN